MSGLRPTRDTSPVRLPAVAGARINALAHANCYELAVSVRVMSAWTRLFSSTELLFEHDPVSSVREHHWANRIECQQRGKLHVHRICNFNARLAFGPAPAAQSAQDTLPCAPRSN